MHAVLHSSVSCIFTCQVFQHHNEKFNYLKHVERLSQTPSFFQNALFQKYPPSGRQLMLCTDEVAKVQDVSVQMCQCFSILISLQPALVVLGNTELEVRHVVFYVLKMKATFLINVCFLT